MDNDKLNKLALLIPPEYTRALYEGLLFYHPELVDPKLVFVNRNKKYSSDWFTVTNNQEFEYKLYKLLEGYLKPESPLEAFELLTQLLDLQAGYAESPHPTPIEANTPGEIKLKEMVEEQERFRSQNLTKGSVAAINASREVERAIAQKIAEREKEVTRQKAAETSKKETSQEQKATKQVFSPAEPSRVQQPSTSVRPPTPTSPVKTDTAPQPKVYLKYTGGIKDESLKPETIEKIKILSQAAHESPREFEETIKNAMIASLPQEIKTKMSDNQVSVVSTLIALDFTNKLLEIDPQTKDFSKPMIDPLTEVLPNLIDPNRADLIEAIPDESLRRQIAGIAQTGMLEIASDADTYDLYLGNALGDFMVVNHFYGSDASGKWDVVKDADAADIAISPFNAIEYFQQTSEMRSIIVRAVQTQNPELVASLNDAKLLELTSKIWWSETGKTTSSGTQSQVFKALSHPSSLTLTEPRTRAMIASWVENNVPLLSPQGAALTAIEAGAAYAQTGFLALPVVSVGVPYFGGSITIIKSSGFAVEFAGQIGTKTFSYALGGAKAAETGAVIAKTTSTVAATAAKGAATKVATEAGKQVAARTALGGLLARLGVGIITGPAGWVATALSLLAVPLYKLLKKKPWLLLAPIAGAFIYVVPQTVAPFIVLGATAITAGALVKTGFLRWSTIATRTLAIVATILFSIPIYVAVILFIINTGAYVVPPPLSTYQEVENPYIQVDKTANPPGPFENYVLDNDEEIEYTIRITAKKNRLTKLKFSETCNVSQEDSPPKCPDADPSLSSLQPPSEILAGATFEIKYKRKFDNKFYDSAVTDVFTATADTPEATGVSDSDSATVIFGDPPLDCPSDWPIPLPQMGQSSLSITQGPRGTYSHTSYSGHEAIDIGTRGIEGFDIVSTHRGIVTAAKGSGENGGYGKYVDIQSVCEGNSFVSRYAHLSVVSVTEGSTVDFKSVVGLSGNTGNSSGPHLHYGFYDGTATYLPMGPAPKNPPYMAPIFIPKDVPYGCPGSCGTIP
jgi:hypothetical protein